MYKQSQPIILASKSPRRQELLKLMGLDFSVELKEVEETFPDGLKPEEIAVHISEIKANAFGAQTGKMIITADTIVALGSEILGKPKNHSHAQEMLGKLSGRSHQVFTGVTIIKDGFSSSFYDMTEVTCRAIDHEEIDFYINSYQPFDKAGSYGIQDWFGLAVVEKINGSYTNVMGLPTEKLYQYLSNLK